MNSNRVSFLILHDDQLKESLKQDLKKQLSGVMNVDDLIWEKYKTDYNSEISNGLDEYDVICFLITPRFIELIQQSNDSWKDILKQARKKHDEKGDDLIPILIESVNWNNLDLLKDLAPLPKSGEFIDTGYYRKRNLALKEIADSIKEVIDYVKQYRENLSTYLENAYQFVQLQLLGDQNSINQLEKIREDLAIKDHDANTIFDKVTQQLKQNFSLYDGTFKSLIYQGHPLTEESREYLNQIQLQLNLKNEIVECIERIAIEEYEQEQQQEVEQEESQHLMNDDVESNSASFDFPFSLILILVLVGLVIIIIASFLKSPHKESTPNPKPSSSNYLQSLKADGWIWLGDVASSNAAEIDQSFQGHHSTNASTVPNLYSRLLVEYDVNLRDDVGSSNKNLDVIRVGEKVIVLRIVSYSNPNKSPQVVEVWAEVYRCGTSCELPHAIN